VHQNRGAASACDQPFAMPEWFCEMAAAEVRVKLDGCHAVQDARIVNVDTLNGLADRVTG